MQTLFEQNSGLVTTGNGCAFTNGEDQIEKSQGFVVDLDTIQREEAKLKEEEIQKKRQSRKFVSPSISFAAIVKGKQGASTAMTRKSPLLNRDDVKEGYSAKKKAPLAINSRRLGEIKER